MPLIAQAPTSRVILGLMTFGKDPSAGARITDINDFNKVLNRFQERGYNEVDTARTYIGNAQEAFTRDAKWKERGLTLATKIHYPKEPGGNAHDKVIESLETSLKELGTDSVDLVYLHAPVCCVQSPLGRTIRHLDLVGLLCLTIRSPTGSSHPLRRHSLRP